MAIAFISINNRETVLPQVAVDEILELRELYRQSSEDLAVCMDEKSVIQTQLVTLQSDHATLQSEHATLLEQLRSLTGQS